jgi:hypothetical protein
MGLLSRTQKGADYMRMNGWFWVQTGPELFDGFSMPAEPNRFFWVSPWKYVTATQPAAPLLSLFICRDETEREALKHICNISNHILSSASSKAITK